MDTKVAVLKENFLDKSKIEEAGKVIRNGGLVAFPTETVYGLGANALAPEAVKKIFEAKGRPQDNPLIIHIAEFEDLKPLVSEVNELSDKIMRSFWPGPMTIILKKSSLVPDVTSAGLETIGIRMPSNQIAMEFIKASKVPVAAPSANISGKPSPTDVSRCIEDLSGKIDYIIGGSNCEVGLESTIIDCTVYPPCILRPGAITLEMLKKIDKNIYIDPAILKNPGEDFKPKAPGMKYRHYAPEAPVKIIRGDIEKTVAKINEIIENNIRTAVRDVRIGIIATDETEKYYKNAVVLSVGSRKDMGSIAKNLFEVLRKFDDLKVDLIYSESFEEDGVGFAVMNRLKKSAGFDIIDI